jgi:hypothetical protein
MYIKMFNKKKNNISFLSLMSDSDDETITDSSKDTISDNYEINKSNINDSSDDDPIEIIQENNSIINNIIDYINNLNKNINVIIDGENLIGGPQQHRESKVKRIFNKYNDINKSHILVVKKSGGEKRFKNYTGVDIPDNYIFISLHADNGTCPDDGFILELSNKIKNTIVVTDDEFQNRESFNYGDIINGTKLTSNINISGRYIPDIRSINSSLIKRRSINKKIPKVQC